MTLKIHQVYSIAKTIINDKTAQGSKYQNKYFTKYTFEKEGYTLNIRAPHSNVTWDDDYWDSDYCGHNYNKGSVIITHNGSTTYAYTKHNVSRAQNRSRLNPISIFTRLRAPLFFHLIDLAEKRVLDQKETIEHKIATLHMKTR